MVLDAVHGAVEALPQFWTVSVHVPEVCPTAVVGETDALNCLTAALALTPGATTTIASRIVNVATSGRRPRRDRYDQIPDISSSPP